MRVLLLITFIIAFLGCTAEKESELASYNIPNGFQLEIVCQEPDIHAPVNLDFDERGRMWIVEMTSYMPNIEGSNEKSNTNKIKILEDTNGDGQMDLVKVFMDSLILPRSLLLAYGGLIYSEPPNLYHVEIIEDKPGKRTLIDSIYATDGNVEHLPSALTLNIDNWIYSSKCNTKYKRVDGKWIKKFTTPRGQWGLTNDNYGRLIYNNNGTLLQADRTIPNALFKNHYLKLEKNNGESVTKNQNVYPIQSTAVNRGYQEGVLNEEDLLINTTSACSPLYYRNKNVSEWDQATFVCLPEINAIKKLHIEHDGWSVSASFENGSEYLSSWDEGFRPVDLKQGPDGSIYIVDMHRGIIQHKAFMTSYLREKILNRKLDTIREMGRILKLSPNDKSTQNLKYDITKDPLTFLYHENAFLRDKAQQHIVQNDLDQHIGQLKKNISIHEDEVHLMHSLWTLQGLDALDEQTLLSALHKPSLHANFTSLYLLSQMDLAQTQTIKKFIHESIAKEEVAYDFLAISSLQEFNFFTSNEKENIYKMVLQRNSDNPFIKEAILANLQSLQELKGAEQYLDGNNQSQWIEDLSQVQDRIKRGEKVYYYDANISHTDNRTIGFNNYRTYCGPCHGVDGEGITDLAPSLIDSEYVSGSEDRLILLTLHGMSGPIHLAGKEYNFNGEMAGINNNDDLGDQEIQDILNFVRNAFASSPYSIEKDRIAELRSRQPAGGGSFTESSLDSLVQLLQ